MKKNSDSCDYFVGFRFSDLSFGEKIEARKLFNIGYLTMDPNTGIIRFTK